MKPIVPRTYLVGVTQPLWEGLHAFLEDTDQLEFAKQFQAAYDEHGPICLCSMFAKMCYRSLVEGKNKNLKGTRDIRENIEGTIKQQHGAVFEHVSMNFVSVNVSRIFTHELVRHRVGVAFSQTSGRYCTPESAEMVLPPEFEKIRFGSKEGDPTLGDDYRDTLTKIKEFVEGARKFLEIDKMPMATRKRWTSALRRIMPSGANNEIAWSINIRALRYLIELRTSPHAEWEIRRVFTDVSRQVYERWPLMLHGGTMEYDEQDDLDIWTGLRI